MMDSEEEEEQTALVCDNGKFRVKFQRWPWSKKNRSKITDLVHNSHIPSKQVNIE